MREIKYGKKFKKDFKREKKSSSHKETIDKDLLKAVKLLAADKMLPKHYCDHPLSGNWKEFRDCHIKPDIILIYKKTGKAVLELIRLGSHSQLGL